MSEQENKVEVKEQVTNETVGVKVEDAPSLNTIPTDIWLQFNTISVGYGEKRQTFDLIEIFKGLEKLGKLNIENK